MDSPSARALGTARHAAMAPSGSRNANHARPFSQVGVTNRPRIRRVREGVRRQRGGGQAGARRRNASRPPLLRGAKEKGHRAYSTRIRGVRTSSRIQPAKGTATRLNPPAASAPAPSPSRAP